MHRCSLISLASIVLGSHACADEVPRSDSAIASGSAQHATVNPVVERRCYRSPQSVLLGPPIGRRNAGHAPGWIQLDGVARGDTGAAELIDANSAGLGGQWYRHVGDSLRVVASDDFLRTELRVAISAESLRGRADARSDADLERDSAGRLGDVRRTWNVSAVRASCDSMPRRRMSDKP
jgi:hypothetical protein